MKHSILFFLLLSSLILLFHHCQGDIRIHSCKGRISPAILFDKYRPFSFHDQIQQLERASMTNCNSWSHVFTWRRSWKQSNNVSLSKLEILIFEAKTTDRRNSSLCQSLEDEIQPSHCIRSRLICSSAPNEIALTSGLRSRSIRVFEICLQADKHVVWDNWV